MDLLQYSTEVSWWCAWWFGGKIKQICFSSKTLFKVQKGIWNSIWYLGNGFRGLKKAFGLYLRHYLTSWINRKLSLCSLGLFKILKIACLKVTSRKKEIQKPFKVKKGLKVRHWTIEIMEKSFSRDFCREFSFCQGCCCSSCCLKSGSRSSSSAPPPSAPPPSAPPPSAPPPSAPPPSAPPPSDPPLLQFRLYALPG
jgi:hypothetical protein